MSFSAAAGKVYQIAGTRNDDCCYDIERCGSQYLCAFQTTPVNARDQSLRWKLLKHTSECVDSIIDVGTFKQFGVKGLAVGSGAVGKAQTHKATATCMFPIRNLWGGGETGSGAEQAEKERQAEDERLQKQADGIIGCFEGLNRAATLAKAIMESAEGRAVMEMCKKTDADYSYAEWLFRKLVQLRTKYRPLQMACEAQQAAKSHPAALHMAQSFVSDLAQGPHENDRQIFLQGTVSEAFVLFKKIDADSNQRIDVKELHTYLTGLGFDLSSKVVQEAVQHVDMDGDGNLSLDEFKRLITVIRITIEIAEITKVAPETTEAGRALRHSVRNTSPPRSARGAPGARRRSPLRMPPRRVLSPTRHATPQRPHVLSGELQRYATPQRPHILSLDNEQHHMHKSQSIGCFAFNSTWSSSSSSGFNKEISAARVREDSAADVGRSHGFFQKLD